MSISFFPPMQKEERAAGAWRWRRRARGGRAPVPARGRLRGAPLDDFLGGPLGGGRAVMDLTVVVDTPAGAPAQTRHRDTIVPGPCASIGVHIPLTRLQAAPVNGAIGFSARSHVLDMREGEQKIDLVGAVPQGSVILYDSFLEHHGLENGSDAPRAALFSWYRVPGVYTGHTDENFGELGLRRTMQLRRLVQERLQEAIAAARAEHPEHSATGLSGATGAAEPHWGFPAGAPLVEWGEERTSRRGAPHGGL
ncbi:unnamed protein product [Prorocentrum cordatum]|uniref:Uncharacterized protein n=1 Tax=Prorocentrum cordatum TaxID=2364126 RepID=A0ABN9WYN4_9DINO|nr:unnamed protein product [Polarella glacialis]